MLKTRVMLVVAASLSLSLSLGGCETLKVVDAVSYTHLDVYKRQP